VAGLALDAVGFVLDEFLILVESLGTAVAITMLVAGFAKGALAAGELFVSL